MAEKKKKLTAKEELFCYYYSRCLNSAEAARKAKYSEDSIYTIGSENLRKPHIISRVRELLKENVQEDELENILSSHLKNISTFNLMNYIDENGNLDIKKLREIDIPGIVNGYSERSLYDKETGKLLNRQITVKTTDSLKSAEILAKIKKIYDEKPEMKLPEKMIFEVIDGRTDS